MREKGSLQFAKAKKFKWKVGNKWRGVIKCVGEIDAITVSVF